jgi:hypothetical protein
MMMMMDDGEGCDVQRLSRGLHVSFIIITTYTLEGGTVMF